MTHRQNTV